MKSLFKFLDICTKDDYKIFSGCNQNTIGSGIYPEHFIPPLQGLKSLLYDLLGDAQHSGYFALIARNEIIDEHPVALKGQNTTKQDSVLFCNTPIPS